MRIVLRNDVEWSLIHWRILGDSPSLVGSSMMGPCDHVCSSLVASILNVQAQVVRLKSDCAIRMDFPSLVVSSVRGPLDDVVAFVRTIAHIEN